MKTENEQLKQQVNHNQQANDILVELQSKNKIVVNEAGEVLIPGIDQIDPV